MTALQKAVLGTPPTGVDGDPVRTANTKFNANVDVLNAQIPLTSFATTLTAGQALTAAAHLGKRVNINVATAQTFQLPSAALCGADGVILLRNLGTVPVTLAITAGSGDTIGMTTLNGVESALFDTDGVHAWNVLVRGRGTSANESVTGNLSLNDVGGSSKVSLLLQKAGVAAWGLGNSSASNALAIDRFVGGSYVDSPLSFANATGVGNFTQRPTVAGNAVWDAGNLDFTKPPAIGLITPAAMKCTTLGATGAVQINGVTNVGSGGAAINTDMITTTGVVNPLAGYRARQGIFGAVSNVFNIAYSASVAYLYIDSTNVGAFAYQSDERIKQAIVDIPSADSTSRVAAMRSIEYRFKDVGIFSDDGTVHRGFSANNLYAIDPKFVTGHPDGLTSDGDVQPMVVNTTAILADVVGALKAAMVRIAALEAKST